MKVKSILDPEFRYVPAVETDLKKTFQRVRREMAREAEASKQAVPVPPVPVLAPAIEQAIGEVREFVRVFKGGKA